MRVITFSRFFPKGHPKAGQPTLFVEKMFRSTVLGLDAKYHTIRAGNRWKVGDRFSARVWSGKPYRSKQVEFAEIVIEKIFDFEKYGFTTLVDDKPINSLTEQEIAKNDGLSLEDFRNWFNKLPFKGQIICWNENVNYC